MEYIKVRYSPQIMYRLAKTIRRGSRRAAKRTLNTAKRFFRFLRAGLPGSERFLRAARGVRYGLTKGAAQRGAVAAFCLIEYAISQTAALRLFKGLAKKVTALDLDFLEGATTSRTKGESAPLPGSDLPVDPFAGLSIYEPNGDLYHLTPEQNIECIRREGLHAPRGCIFLTDDLRSQRGYLKWKTRMLGRDAVFCVLRIDAAALGRLRTLYSYNAHRIVVERVEPEYIVWE